MNSAAVADYQVPVIKSSLSRRRRRRAIDLLLCAAAVSPILVHGSFARGTDYSWVGSSGVYDAASNWENSGGGNGIPGSSDTAIFTTGTTIFDDNESLLANVVGTMYWSLGGGYTVISETNVSGSLELAGFSTFSTNELYVTGSCLASGADIAITNDALQINNGGAATLSGDSTVTDSVDVSVGLDAFSSLVIQGGSVLNSSQAGFFGSGVGGGFDSSGNTHYGSGSVLVTGAGSLWHDNYLISIADPGSGASLTVQNGGVVSASNFAISNGTNPLGGSVASGPGNVVIDGMNSALKSGSSQYIGIDGQATLTIQYGATDQNTGFMDMGYSSTAAGTLIVQDGANAETDGTVYGGDGGAGTIEVLSEGSLTVGTLLGGNQQSASVFVSVDGESSEFFVSGLADIGVSGSGTVSVTNGGAFYPGDLTLGDQMGAKGVGTVDGADSVLSAVAALNVGNNGNGTLTAQNNGEASSLVNVTIGVQNGGNGTVIVNNGNLQVGQDLIVGSQGNGTLNIMNGGTADVTGDLRIGDQNGGAGTVSVNSSASISVTGDMYVGNGGGGTLNVSLDSNASVLGDLLIAAGTSSTSQANVGLGSTLTVNGGVAVGGTTSAAGGNGTLQVSGAVSVFSNITVWQTGTVAFSMGDIAVGIGRIPTTPGEMIIYPASELNVYGQLTGGTVDNQGEMDLQQVPEITDVRSVRPDVSADVVIDANYINEAGATISIDIAGSGADDYDHLTILGSASIDGAVILNFINGFTPSDGDLYDLFTFDDLLNDFSDNIQVDGLAPGWQYELIQNGDEYEIESLSDGLPAPEPGLSALLVTGGLLLGRRRRAGWR